MAIACARQRSSQASTGIGPEMCGGRREGRRKTIGGRARARTARCPEQALSRVGRPGRGRWVEQDWGGVGRAACRQLELCSQRAERRVRRHKSSMLMYVMLMLMLLVVVVTMTMMTMIW